MFEQILAAHNGGAVEAATHVAQGLMAHDPSDPPRQGYTPENAALAAADVYALNFKQRVGLYVALGVEDMARREYGDEFVDEWFRADGWDPDAARAES